MRVEKALSSGQWIGLLSKTHILQLIDYLTFSTNYAQRQSFEEKFLSRVRYNYDISLSQSHWVSSTLEMLRKYHCWQGQHHSLCSDATCLSPLSCERVRIRGVRIGRFQWHKPEMRIHCWNSKQRGSHLLLVDWNVWMKHVIKMFFASNSIDLGLSVKNKKSSAYIRLSPFTKGNMAFFSNQNVMHRCLVYFSGSLMALLVLSTGFGQGGDFTPPTTLCAREGGHFRLGGFVKNFDLSSLPVEAEITCFASRRTSIPFKLGINSWRIISRDRFEIEVQQAHVYVNAWWKRSKSLCDACG